MAKEQTIIIEAAYYAGFEPSVDNLTGDALFAEAQEYLTSLN